MSLLKLHHISFRIVAVAYERVYRLSGVGQERDLNESTRPAVRSKQCRGISRRAAEITAT